MSKVMRFRNPKIVPAHSFIAFAFALREIKTRSFRAAMSVCPIGVRQIV